MKRTIWDELNSIADQIIDEFEGMHRNFESIRAYLQEQYGDLIGDGATPFMRMYIRERVERQLATEHGIVF